MVSEIPFRHDINDCLAANIGAGGLSDQAFKGALTDAEPLLESLRAGGNPELEALLRLPGRDDDLAALEAVAERLRERFDDVAVLGTGGSSLGGQTLVALASPGARPRLHFMDNIDPGQFEELLAGSIRRAPVILRSRSRGAPPRPWPKP